MFSAFIWTSSQRKTAHAYVSAVLRSFSSSLCARRVYVDKQTTQDRLHILCVGSLAFIAFFILLCSSPLSGQPENARPRHICVGGLAFTVFFSYRESCAAILLSGSKRLPPVKRSHFVTQLSWLPLVTRRQFETPRTHTRTHAGINFSKAFRNMSISRQCK